MAHLNDNIRVSVANIDGAQGYPLNVRIWQPVSKPDAKILILHGVVSHSEWLAPIAERLAANNVEVICPDRRGSGLNTDAPGDAPGADALIEDVSCVARQFGTHELPLHLAGFCWGFNYAINCAEKLPGRFASLVAIAPTVFPARDIAECEVQIGESGAATETPLVPIDRFTTGPAYKDFIVPDPLRTNAVSRRFNSIMMQMNSMIAVRWTKLRLANLVILASNDRLADNAKHRIGYSKLCAKPKRMIAVDGEHGLQFDAAERTAEEITVWTRMEGFRSIK